MGVLTISCFSAICLVSALALQNQANFEIVKGKKIVNATKTIRGVSQLSCAASCLSLAVNGECNAAGYRSDSKDCHLSSHMLDAAVENATDEWNLLIPKTGMMKIYSCFICDDNYKVAFKVSYYLSTIVDK